MADEKDISERTIAEDIVVTKYKLAGEIANKTLSAILAVIVDGASVKELCDTGDKLILKETSQVFKKDKELKKGIAFPTCLSVNNCVCHYSPTKSEADLILKDGDLVKIDLGVHIDGFIAVVAYTVVIGASQQKKATGRKADAVLAAYWASQAALRLLKPGTGNYAVTEAVQKISESYKCKPIEGMLSHQLKQFKMDGEKTIIQNPNDAQKKEHDKCEFELHEVYAMDVLISTGEGVGKEYDTKTSIYKKTDENYQLKVKASRALISEIIKKHGPMPFNLRHFEEETKARMGVVECVAHKMIEPFQVLYEKQTEFVAQFKYTVLMMPNGVNLVTGIPFPTNQYNSSNAITDPEMKELVQASLTPAKAAKKQKKKATSESDGGVAAAAPAAASATATSTTTTATTTTTTAATKSATATKPAPAAGATKATPPAAAATKAKAAKPATGGAAAAAASPTKSKTANVKA